MPDMKRIRRPDGSIWTIDEAGNVLNKEPPSVGGEELGISERTWKDPVREYISPFLRSAVVTAGGAGGAIAGTGTAGPGPGTIAGLMLGGTAGDLAYQQAQRFDPRLFGAPPSESMSESITEAVLNAGLEATANKVIPGIGRKLSTPLKEILPRGIRKTFKGQITSAERNALLRDPPIEFDVPQATGSRAGTVAADVLAPAEREALFAKQQAGLGENVSQLLTEIAGEPSTLATTTEARALAGHAKAFALRRLDTKTERDVWNLLERDMLPEITEQVIKISKRGRPKTYKMETPVAILETNKWATEMFDSLQKQLNDPLSALTKEARASLIALRSALNPFVDPPMGSLGINKGNPVIGYQDAKMNKSALSDALKDAPETIKKRYSQTAKVLRSKLSKDIDNAMEALGEPYLKVHQVAKAKTISNAAKFQAAIQRDVVNLYDDPDVVQEKVINEALSSVQRARQYIKATGSKGELGEELVRKIFNNPSVRDTTTGYFDGAQGLNALKRVEDLSRTVLTAEQRSGLKFLLNRMKAVDPQLHNTGMIAFTIRHIGAMLSLTGGATAALSSGNLTTGVATSGGIVFVAVPMGKKFVRNVLLDPKIARQVAIMAKNPPGSPETRVAQRLVMRALNGARAYVQYQGQNLPAEIRDGQVRLLEEPDESVQEPPGFLENIGSWVKSGI